MAVPGLGVKSELQLPVYATATATPDPKHIYYLHCSLQQFWILNPLSKARDWTHIPFRRLLVWYHFICLFSLLFLLLGGDTSRKILPRLKSKSAQPIFFPRNFMVSGLTFKSLIYFELIFVSGVRKWSNFIFFFFCMWLSSFSNSTYQRHCPFLTVYSLLLCHKLIEHMCIYFCALNSVALVYVSVFVLILYCFGYYGFVV